MKKLSNLNIAIVASAITLSVASFSNAQEYESNKDGTDRKEMKKGYHKGKKGKHGHNRAKMMLEKVDSNQDGNVDLNEYLAHAEERFNSLDLDSNGFVTQEEAKQAMQTMREEHKERRKEMRKKRKQEAEQEAE